MIIYKRDLFTKCQAIRGEMYLAKNGNAFKLNETGLKVWNLLDGEIGVLEIAGIIANEFKIDISVAEKDVNKFIQMLLVRNLIQEVTNN